MRPLRIIRPVADDDWSQIVPIIQDVARDGRTYAVPYELTDEECRSFWSDAARVVVFADGPVILGTAKMGPNRPNQGAHIGTASFMVAEHARGIGVGTALLDDAIEWHRQQGFRGIQFNAVVESNAGAVALWQSRGFEIVGTVPGAFRLPDGSYTGLHVMFLDLAG